MGTLSNKHLPFVYELTEKKYRPVAETPEQFKFIWTDDWKITGHFGNFWD